LSFPNGVPVPYYYTNPTMLGFSGGGGSTYGGDAEPIISPVVGNWSMPPAYRESFYDKARETASPGYYSVYLDTFKTHVELTATRWAKLDALQIPGKRQSQHTGQLPRAWRPYGDRRRSHRPRYGAGQQSN